MLNMVLGDLKALLTLLTEALSTRIDPVQGEQSGAVGQVVEEGGGLAEEEWQIVFDTRWGQAVADIAVDHTLLRIALETAAIGLAEVADRRLVQRKLPCREQTYLLHLLLGALALRVEDANALHLIVEEFNAKGLATAHGEEVEQATTYGELTVLHHLGDAAVACVLQTAAHRFQLDSVATIEGEAVGVDIAPWRDALHQGGDREDKYPLFQLRQALQCGEALGDDVLMGGEGVVGEGLPVRETEQWQGTLAVVVETQFVFQPCG